MRQAALEHLVCGHYRNGMTKDNLSIRYGISMAAVDVILQRNGVRIWHQGRDSVSRGVEDTRIRSVPLRGAGNKIRLSSLRGELI